MPSNLKSLDWCQAGVCVPSQLHKQEVASYQTGCLGMLHVNASLIMQQLCGWLGRQQKQ